MPSKSIPLWRLQKYKKLLIPDFDIPDDLAVMPTPSGTAEVSPPLETKKVAVVIIAKKTNAIFYPQFFITSSSSQ